MAIENFTFEVLDSSDKIKDIEALEMYYIDVFNSLEKYGNYNIQKGGRGIFKTKPVQNDIKNKFANIPLKDFSSKEISVLVSILKSINLVDKIFTLDLYKIKDESMVWHKYEIIDFILSVKNKLQKSLEKNPFNVFNINEDDYYLNISIKKEFSFLIYDTIFVDLNILNSLSSMFNKIAYIQLVPYKPIGYRKYDIEEFRKFFNVKKSYKNGNIDQNILNPMKKEIVKIFPNFRIEKIKGRGRNSRSIQTIIFYIN